MFVIKYSIKHGDSLLFAVSSTDGCMTGLVSSQKKTVGHLVHTDGGYLSGAFANVGDAFDMQREPLMARHRISADFKTTL